MYKKKDRLKFSSPNMGDYNKLVFRTLMEKLGQEYFLPPPITADTVRMGTRYSHELACQPYRISLGDEIRAIQSGANAIILSAGADACRYRYYWSSQKQALRRILDRDIPFFVIKHEDVVGSLETFAECCEVGISQRELLDLMRTINLKIDLYDALGILYRMERMHDRSAARFLYGRYWNIIEKTGNSVELESVFAAMKRDFESLTSGSGPAPELKVMLIGSVYEVLETEANNHVEDMLADLGALTIPMLNYHALASFRCAPNEAAAFCDRFRPAHREMGRRLLSLIKTPSLIRHYGFGGFGSYNIGLAACAKDLGYDGVIHLYPFFCMPEIIAKSFLKEISVAQDIPIMSIVTDENNSDLGFRAKVEAFVDLLQWKKRRACRV